ncbi:DUF2189 domain-containing protein [Litoreibacter janthinus]|uniref:Uncharacterized membrane protein n=1 Tax=Litoreibacter janthinus TaxID=670154 RepID=A0A1I6GWC2_9RHOB|nr:DUF2189 domain-containing protein [Litoreibacter janthinus]SFR46515.1 Uncharacterized membrane protein [Litoreibacter janthinus]
MTQLTEPAASPRPEIGTVTFWELLRALREGWRDFTRAPAYGLFFSAFYVLCGAGLVYWGAGTFTWTLVLALGFPIVAPFAAVGLYEVSRRLEAEEPLTWSSVLSVVWAERGRQLPWIGALLVLIFLFWSFFAHMSLALFLGNMQLINITTSWEVFQSPTGIALIAFQIFVGGVVALMTYTITVVSMPLLLDREIDFMTAMGFSIRTVLHNRAVMLLWAAIIAIVVLVALVPMFLGLFLALPVLGHATWHIYRRALYTPT